MCLCRQGTRYYDYGLLSKIVFDDNCFALPGLFSHAEAVAAVAGVGVTCGCCVNRAELQLAVIRHHLYSLSTLGLARVCRPAAVIADPEP